MKMKSFFLFRNIYLIRPVRLGMRIVLNKKFESCLLKISDM